MKYHLTHVCPVMTGGVFDFVDVCVQHQEGAIKLPLDEAGAGRVSLSGDVILHMSGYGYAKRGAPTWLLRKIEADRSRIRMLGVYFHELYAFAPPWRSSFWLSPLQRHIARRLAELSDFWMTNREDAAGWLRRFAGDRPGIVLPVFSTVGEMPHYLATDRKGIVIFGGPVLRAATYRAAGEALFRWAAEQQLEIHDVGPPISESSVHALIDRAGVTIHGRLAPEQVGHLLAAASFGVMAYAADSLGKSSVFAAYCAHGVCPVVIGARVRASDGLRAGEHFVPGMPEKGMTDKSAAEIGRAAWQWYQSHDVAAHIGAQHHLLSGTPSRVGGILR